MTNQDLRDSLAFPHSPTPESPGMVWRRTVDMHFNANLDCRADELRATAIKKAAPGCGVREARKQAPGSVPGGMERRSLRRRRPVSRVDPIHGPEADKLADQCIRMRRFINEHRAVLAAKVSVLATVTGWEADDTWDWVARQAERERCSR